MTSSSNIQKQKKNHKLLNSNFFKFSLNNFFFNSDNTFTIIIYIQNYHLYSCPIIIQKIYISNKKKNNNYIYQQKYICIIVNN